MRIYKYDPYSPNHDVIEWARAYWDAFGWQFSGFMTALGDDVQESVAKAAFADPDIYAFSYYGHGGSMTFVGDSHGGLGMLPFDVRPLLKHGLAQFNLQGCHAYDFVWSNLVSPKGTFGGYDGGSTAGGSWNWKTVPGTYH
jgi:hypothetical protein